MPCSGVIPPQTLREQWCGVQPDGKDHLASMFGTEEDYRARTADETGCMDVYEVPIADSARRNSYASRRLRNRNMARDFSFFEEEANGTANAIEKIRHMRLPSFRGIEKDAQTCDWQGP